MVGIFAEVKRVLKDDGTLWVNMGDSYCATNPGGGGEGLQRTNRGSRVKGGQGASGCKPKDLIGQPWELAFALRRDGWYLRSDIIWAKPNPMPESVTDRPTKAHEYIFLLTKSEKYYYDAEAIAEPKAYSTQEDDRGNENGKRRQRGFPGEQSNGGTNLGGPGGNRNKRSVWTVATQPFPEAHFAVFPEDLIKPCILAGSRQGDMVLDPFAGSGTTGKVSIALGRNFTGIELNVDYVAMAVNRIGKQNPALPLYECVGGPVKRKG